MVNWTLAIVLGLLMFSCVSVMYTLSDAEINEMFSLTNSTVVEELRQEYTALGFWEKTKSIFWSGARKLSHFGLFAQSLNNLVPTFRYQLPGTDKHIVGINDIPYFDGTDMFLIIPLMAIPWYFLKKAKAKKTMNIFLIVALAVLLLFIAFLVTKAIYYQLYLYSSHQVGLSTAQAITIRENYILHTEASKMPLIISSLLGGVAIAYSFLIKKKK